jgi:hypothetical protein
MGSAVSQNTSTSTDQNTSMSTNQDNLVYETLKGHIESMSCNVNCSKIKISEYFEPFYLYGDFKEYHLAEEKLITFNYVQYVNSITLNTVNWITFISLNNKCIYGQKKGIMRGFTPTYLTNIKIEEITYNGKTVFVKFLNTSKFQFCDTDQEFNFNPGDVINVMCFQRANQFIVMHPLNNNVEKCLS